MNIKIICIGNLKEKYWKEAVLEYGKRLDSYCKLEIAELKEAKLPNNASSADEVQVKEADPLHTSLTPYEKFCYAMLQFAERCIGK